MSKYIYILDTGHGGVINGVPQTAGKRSPDWESGILYEGESNRRIAAKVKDLLDNEGISCLIIPNSLRDAPLSSRVQKANSINKFKPSVLLSFHSDAFHDEKANGWSAFTYYGETKSDKIATILYSEAKKSKLKLRTDFSDGDPDKEANFFILRKTDCPAVLIENLFMTNKKDYKYLMSEKGQNTIARMIFRAIKRVENEKI